MIKDRLINADTYYGISESLQRGFEWLRVQDLKNIECGQYEIDGKKIYANIQEYETKTEANYESHRKYIDIQYMIEGKELVGVTDISNCQTVETYNEERDLEFFSITRSEHYEELSEGEFLVFFPQDAHKPSMACETKSKVKKVVVKILID